MARHANDEPFAEPHHRAAGSGVIPGGQWRRIEADNKVDESASLGHVEGSCGADEGDGIVPGATGWTTVTLAPGRYELICNIAGHYRAGMYALLEVTG